MSQALVRELYAKQDEAYAQRVQGIARVKYWIARTMRPLHRRVEAIRRTKEILEEFGNAVRRATGIGLRRQALQQYRCCVRYGIPPEKYYLYAIYNDYERADQYIPQNAWWQLLENLVSIQAESDRIILDDKRASDRHFRQHGLPIIPILAEFEDGEVVPREWDGRLPLPATDLFSKPIDASFGDGARRWFVQSDGRYQTEEGTRIEQDELFRRLQQQSEKRAVLLQRRVVNHPRVQELTGPRWHQYASSRCGSQAVMLSISPDLSHYLSVT